MRLRRALFRLWIIFAVLFASYTMALAIWSFQETSAELAAWDQPGNPYHKIGQLVDPPNPWRNLATLTGLAFGMPLLALVLGRVLFWAVDEFGGGRRTRLGAMSDGVAQTTAASADATDRRQSQVGRS